MKNLDDLKPGDKVLYRMTEGPLFTVKEVKLKARHKDGRLDLHPMVLIEGPAAHPDYEDRDRSVWVELAHVTTPEEQAAQRALEHLDPQHPSIEVATGRALDQMGHNFAMVRMPGETDAAFRDRILGSIR